MKLSFAQLKEVVADYVAEQKVSLETFQDTYNNTVGLLDTIGKINTVVHSYVDKLEELDGEFLSYGKTIEEWASDLLLVEDFDADGDGALSRHNLTYRPVYFSYTLGRKKIPLSIFYDDIERAVHNEGEFAEIIADKYKKLSDSETVFRYTTKRQILGVLASIVLAINETSDTFNVATSYTKADIGSCFKSGNDVYMLVKPYTADDVANVQGAIDEGYLIKMDLVEELAKPVDAETGEDFIISLKKQGEIASDNSEGHSLNGATLGATPSEGLMLYVKQGVMPYVDVKTQAGAFHLEKVAVPFNVKPLPDFGNADDDVWAILVDSRAVKLHPTYLATRENGNGDGDFLNIFRHMEYTGYISRNAYVRVFKTPAEAEAEAED